MTIALEFLFLLYGLIFLFYYDNVYCMTFHVKIFVKNILDSWLYNSIEYNK